VVGTQIANLTYGPSFGHNLCFNYPNGSCEPILDIYVPRVFQWYKGIFNPMGFDPLQSLSEDSRIHLIPIPKVGTHLGVWKFIPSHSLTFLEAWNVTPGLHTWPAPLQALSLVVSPRLGLQQLWHCALWGSLVLVLHTCLMSLVLNACFGKFGVNVNLFDEFILNESKEIRSKLLTFFMFGNLIFYV
jgi:hypothetical protein